MNLVNLRGITDINWIAALHVFIFLKCLALFFCNCYAATLEVGPGKQYSNPAQAAANAVPGDTFLIFPFEYRGTFFIRYFNPYYALENPRLPKYSGGQVLQLKMASK